VSEKRERELHSCFYIGHSITELHPVFLENLSLVSTIFKSFTNQPPRLDFWTKNHIRFSTHKNLDNYPARITLTDLKSHQKTNQRHKLSLANHTCVLRATHKPKCLQDQLRSSNNKLQLCIAER